MTLSSTQRQNPEPPVELHLRALENLDFIRETISRSGVFTAVPGQGMMGMGLVATVGAYVAALRLSQDWWIYTWIGVAVLAWSIGMGTMAVKARRVAQPIWTGLGRRVLIGFSPAIVAGIVLTEVFYEFHLDALLPGMWLLLYGVGICGAGAFSVRIVPLLGMAFMAASLLAFYVMGFEIHSVPPAIVGPLCATDLVLLAGFGGLHLGFGFSIARYYGG